MQDLQAVMSSALGCFTVCEVAPHYLGPSTPLSLELVQVAVTDVRHGVLLVQVSIQTSSA